MKQAISLFLSSALFGMLSYTALPACAQANYYLFLDGKTLAHGYTATYEESNVRLGIPPHALLGTASLTIAQIATKDTAFHIAPPPAGAQFASPLLSYSFGDTVSLHSPLTLSIAVHRSSALVRLYAFDPIAKRWKRLDHQIINSSSVTATIDQLSDDVAALEFPSDHEELAYLLSLPKAVMVADKKNTVFVTQNTHASLPLASLTKLMTALVFLDANREWDAHISIVHSDDTPPAKISFHDGDVVLVRDLFYGMLVGSKNNAARALARSTGLSEKQFVDRMNEKASALGLKDTHFSDVTGLSPGNTSSVRDYAAVMRVAFASSVIRSAIQTRKYTIHVLNRRATFFIETTDEVLDGSKTVYGKTGYIPEAGYNLILAQERPQDTYYILIFGAPTSEDRFDLARALLARTR